MASVDEHHRAPDTGAEKTGNRFLRQAAITVLVAIQAVVLAWFGEFALGDALMGRAMARIAAPVVGLFYGDGARDQLLVVHLDAPSLQAAGGNWPLPYRYHARILRSLAAFEPASVFVDFTFESARQDDSIGEFAETLCELHRQGITVFLAAPASNDGTPLRKELEDIRGTSGSGCFEAVGVEQVRDTYDRMSWNYPLYSRPGTHGELPSAALAMARLKNPELADEAIAPREQMTLSWGTRASRSGLDWMESAAHEGGENGHGETRLYCQEWLVSSLLPAYLQPGSFLHPHAADVRPICVFHDSVTSGEVLRRKTIQESQRLGALVKGRAVLYGASFNMGDFAISPVHDEIPGVYLHAMAADNLLHFGTRWKRMPEGGDAGTIHWLFLFAGFLVVTASFRGSAAVLDWLRSGLMRRLRLPAVAPLFRQRLHWSPDGKASRGVFAMLKVLAYVGISSFAEAISGFVRFLFLALLPGSLLVYFAHHVMNYGILAYAEIIVFCALAEALELGERAEHAIARALGESRTSHEH